MEKVQIYVLSRENSKWIFQAYSQSPKDSLLLSASGARVCPSGLPHSHMLLVPYGCGLPHCNIYPSKYQMSKMCCFLTKPEIKVITCIIKKNSLVSQKNLKFSSLIYFLLHLNVSLQIWLLAWEGSLQVKMAENSELGAIVTDLQEIKVEHLWKLLSVKLPYIRFWRNTSIL